MSSVAIDCRTLQDRPIGGVGRSLAHLLGHLDRALELDLLIDSRRPPPSGAPDGVRMHALAGPLTGRGFAWLQTAAPRWLRGYRGVFHCPFYGLPYVQPVSMVVTIHDLTFEFAPRWQSPERNFVFRRQARWAARTARRIIVHSHHVGAMVLERYGSYGASAERLAVIPFPPDPRFEPYPPGAEELRARLGLHGRYVLALGGAPRRQLPVAVAAWRQALARIGAEPDEIPLFVVSRQAPAAEPGVRHAGAVDDETWTALLAGADALCYPTVYEGYGVPAIEAAACATPIVCARVGALPELLGDSAAWAEEPEPGPVGSALAELLADGERARTLGSLARARVQKLPSWEQAAGATAAVYREAAS